MRAQIWSRKGRRVRYCEKRVGEESGNNVGIHAVIGRLRDNVSGLGFPFLMSLEGLLESDGLVPREVMVRTL